ncbi:hypothetical protein E2562_003637 [Oryza meyeriana var. granulata]|uniref:Uncharacterized protein n=1 Tax=Oryza meyeriana var. granulata TaxID=110450 RepID=A0A6G1C3L1_9ORYZ|nr:hypothetical protein E2562_003637 [Oryza meyeriana var. granulata]
MARGPALLDRCHLTSYQPFCSQTDRLGLCSQLDLPLAGPPAPAADAAGQQDRSPVVEHYGGMVAKSMLGGEDQHKWALVQV